MKRGHTVLKLLLYIDEKIQIKKILQSQRRWSTVVKSYKSYISKNLYIQNAPFNNYIGYMTTSVSRMFNIFCTKLRIRAFFITPLLNQLCMRVGILLTCGKHLHDCIISRGPLNTTTFPYQARKVSGHVNVCAVM
jgi:hypothetical protein